jgi:hypothetical protein
MAEDPELERRLEAMFSSARPRPGFEDELWRRIEARRPWYRRIGFQPALRYAPALATLLVVALGVTWLANNLRGGPASSSSATTAGAPAFGSAQNAAPAFGVLPALRPGAEKSATAPEATAGAIDSAAGRSLNGTLPTLPSVLPVYRYDEPSAIDLSRTDAALQARSGLAAVAVTHSDAARGIEPQFSFTAPTAGAAPGTTSEGATAFLASHSMLPSFSYQLSPTGSAGRVIYGRVFDGPTGAIRQVRPDGSSAGLIVDISGGSINASGPLDLPLTIGSYPLRSAAAALSAVNVRPGSTAGAFDHAELVYVLVVSGGHGYYEPALLLTGTGVAMLAPVIAPGWLGR